MAQTHCDCNFSSFSGQKLLELHRARLRYDVQNRPGLFSVSSAQSDVESQCDVSEECFSKFLKERSH